MNISSRGCSLATYWCVNTFGCGVTGLTVPYTAGEIAGCASGLDVLRQARLLTIAL